MNLRVGLFPYSRVWEDLCDIEGITVVPVPPQGSLDPGAYSVVVVTAAPDREGLENLEGYLGGGGGVLGYALHLEGLGGISTQSKWLNYLLPDAESIPRCAGLIDLGMEGAIPREARHWRTQDHMHAIAVMPLRGGQAVALPFDPVRAFLDTRAAGKSFYAIRDRLPTERVSLVAKGAVHHLLHCALEHLHHTRGLPYCHLWWYPAGGRSVFGMRVDTDGAPRKDIDDLYAIAREFGMGFTWFLDVASHESWLSHFGTLAGQECGVHCYQHRQRFDHTEILKDLTRAKRLMEEAGMRPVGVAAPFGVWSEAFSRVAEELGFRYSSEFAAAYDMLPYHPWSAGGPALTLQVPIHPICIGSLRRVGYSVKDMEEYFERVIREKLAWHEPLLFYHHPSDQTGQVLRLLCSRAMEEEVATMTLGEYATWWDRRRAIRVACALEEGRINLRCAADGGAPPDMTIHITRKGGEEALTPLGENIELSALKWRTTLSYFPPHDLERIREFDPRAMLGELYASMLRRMR
jgi:hypothetical protein